jgi:hypothetical protein
LSCEKVASTYTTHLVVTTLLRVPFDTTLVLLLITFAPRGPSSTVNHLNGLFVFQTPPDCSLCRISTAIPSAALAVYDNDPDFASHF